MLRFKYKLPILDAVLMVSAAIAVTVSLGYIAYADVDSRLARWIARTFSSDAPSFFFWALTVLSFLASLFVLRFAVRGHKGGHVELGPLTALLPKSSLSLSLIEIPYAAITKIQLVSIKKTHMAIISSSVGESRFSSKWFAPPNEFVAFLKALQERRHAKISEGIKTVPFQPSPSLASGENTNEAALRAVVEKEN